MNWWEKFKKRLTCNLITTEGTWNKKLKNDINRFRPWTLWLQRVTFIASDSANETSTAPTATVKYNVDWRFIDKQVYGSSYVGPKMIDAVVWAFYVALRVFAYFISVRLLARQWRGTIFYVVFTVILSRARFSNRRDNKCIKYDNYQCVYHAR